MKEFRELPADIVWELKESVRYEEARLFGVKELELLMRDLGSNHPDTLNTMHNIAVALGSQGKYEEALKFYQEVLDKRKQILGPDHPSTLNTMHGIAVALDSQGKYEEALTAYKEICKKGSDNMTPLHLVSHNGFKELVKLLLTNGADVLARNNHDTVLHRAVSSNNKEVIELILDKIKEKRNDIEPYINAPDTEGDTLLMWAAESGKINATQILLKYGADVNVRNNDGQTALDWAAKGNHKEIVQLLLDKQLGIKDRDGKTPI